jgi:hypothetical protein
MASTIRGKFCRGSVVGQFPRDALWPGAAHEEPFAATIGQRTDATVAGISPSPARLIAQRPRVQIRPRHAPVSAKLRKHSRSPSQAQPEETVCGSSPAVRRRAGIGGGLSIAYLVFSGRYRVLICSMYVVISSKLWAMVFMLLCIWSRFALVSSLPVSSGSAIIFCICPTIPCI